MIEHKTVTVRTIASELAIGLAVCAGAYLGIVDPLEQRAADARAQGAALQARLDQSPERQLQPDKAERLIVSGLMACADVEHRNAPARSESAMFSALSSLAGENHVRIDQVQPTTPFERKPVIMPDGKPAPAAKLLPGDARSAYAIAAVGEFADMVRFVDALTTKLGYTSVRTVRISPASEPGSTAVHANISTEHFAFALTGPAAEEAKP